MMNRWMGIALAGAIGIAAVGCGTTRGVHTVPVSRDYARLEHVDLDEAEMLIEEARRRGGPYDAPYDYYAAARYLAAAQEQARERDRRGAWDYGILARMHGEKAASAGSLSDVGAPAPPADEAACQALFDDLKAAYLALDRDQARLVAPYLYGGVELALSRAEHELLQGNRWKRAAELMRFVPTDLEIIRTQDTDGDGVPDMADGAPWAPEDVDGFEDEDGVPDPDNDQDGIHDVNDLAPNDPETQNRWHDHDGAPDAYPTLERIEFAVGSASIGPEERGYLRGIAELVKEWPDLKLHIAGYPDVVGEESQGMALAQRRAERVYAYLTEIAGCRAEQLVVTFHGDAAVGDGAVARRVRLFFE